MRGISRFAWVLVLALLAGSMVPSLALAFEQRSGDAVTVSDNVADDLYVFGSTIDVSGDVEGDVVAFGKSITISGEVSGNVIAAGQTVRVEGPVGGSVRAAGQDVQVEGMVSGDVVLAGSTIGVATDAAVGRDAVVGGGVVTLDGDVTRNVVAGAGTMTISSAVGGDVTADVDKLTVADTGSIAGNLTYYSDNQAQVSGTVVGQTQRHPARTQQGEEAKSPSFGALVVWAVFAWIQSLIGMALFAVLAVLALRGFAPMAADRVFARPWPCIGIGFAVAALAFPAAGIVFIPGLFIGTWWIAFVLLALVWLLALAGLVVGALAVGRWALGRMATGAVHPIWAALAGLVIIWLINIVPFVGWLAGCAAMLFGMGAIVLAAYGPPMTAVAAEPVAAPTAPVSEA